MVLNNEAIEFSTSAILWPSFIKAEMLACLTALMVVLVQAKVTLNTDSITTIAGFAQIENLMNLSVQK